MSLKREEKKKDIVQYITMILSDLCICIWISVLCK